MTVHNLLDAFLLDLSLAHAGERTGVQILEESAAEVTDERARAVLTRHVAETRTQIRWLRQVFALAGAQPQIVGCPMLEGVRRELDHFRQQDPAPAFLTVANLVAQLRIAHTEVATYGVLADQAEVLGQTEAARILVTIARQEAATAATISRLLHDLVRESAGASGAARRATAAAMS